MTDKDSSFPMCRFWRPRHCRNSFADRSVSKDGALRKICCSCIIERDPSLNIVESWSMLNWLFSQGRRKVAWKLSIIVTRFTFHPMADPFIRILTYLESIKPSCNNCKKRSTSKLLFYGAVCIATMRTEEIAPVWESDCPTTTIPHHTMIFISSVSARGKGCKTVECL